MRSFGVKRGLMALPVAVGMLFLPAVVHASNNVDAVSAGAAYLASQQGSGGNIAGFDSGASAWSAIAFEAAGRPISGVAISGGQSLETFLAANPPAGSAAATEWERDILAITAAGKNPRDFGGTNYVAGLEALHIGGQFGMSSAVNDDYYAVLALVAAKVNPTDAGLTDAVNFVLANKRADGGYSYSTDTSVGSDTDDTAGVLMALVVARDWGVSASGLDDAILAAKTHILGTQLADGGFPYDPLGNVTYGETSSNVSTTSWVVMAFDSDGLWGDDATVKARGYLRSLQWTDGSFPSQKAGPGDTFDTPTAIVALAGGYFPLRAGLGESIQNDTVTSGQVQGDQIDSTPPVVAVIPAVASDAADAPQPRLAAATTSDSKAEPAAAPAVTPSPAPSPEVLAARTATVASSNQPPISSLRIALAVGLALAGVLGPVAYFLRRRFSRP